MKPIGLFLTLTLLFSTPFYYLSISNGNLESLGPIGILGLMWAPAIAAIITSLILRISLGEIKWKFGNVKFLVISYLLPLSYVVLSYSFAWGIGIASFPSPDFIEILKKNITTDLAQNWLLVFGFIVVSTLFLIITSISTLGEELGWRGFLLPQLLKRYSAIRSSVLVSIIWAAWHYPIILFANYNNGAPFYIYLPSVTLFIFAMSFILTWLRIKSNSIWTAVVFHAAHNVLIQGYFDPVTVHSNTSRIYIGEFGLISAVVAAMTAIILFWFYPIVSNYNSSQIEIKTVS